MVTESQGKYSKNRKIKSPADEVSCEAMAEIVNGSAKIKKNRGIAHEVRWLSYVGNKKYLKNFPKNYQPIYITCIIAL